MRVVETSPDDPDTALLLDAYFDERTAGFPEGAYQVARPGREAFAPPGVLLRIDGDDGPPLAVGGLRPLAGGTRRMEVKHLYVVPDGRGSGIGRRLLTLLEQAAREAGAVELVLDTNRSLEAAGALYRTAGFTPTAPYNDNPNATDWFVKPLR